MSEQAQSVLDDDGPDALGESAVSGETEAPPADHNSRKLKDIIVQCAKERVEIDAARKMLNRKAADIREVLVDHGVDKEAFNEEYNYHKKKRHEREGFDESAKLVRDALADPEQASLFDVLKDEA